MQLTVLQWNVWYKESNRNIAEFLRSNGADIICLQELTIEEGADGHAPQYIAKQLGYNSYFKEIGLEQDKITMANGIFSRYPIVSTKSVWVNRPSGSGGYDDEYRALIVAEIQAGGRRITIATTHMSYTHRFDVTPRKEQETNMAYQAIALYQDSFILTGDLNATPGSYTANKLTEHLKNASPDYAQPTWTTKPFSYNGFEETELRWRLDYIFATPDLQVQSTEILSTTYSDHLPIRTTFEL